MSGVPPPVARLVVLCDDVSKGGENGKELTCIRLLTNIHPLGEPRYPYRLRRLCVHVQLTECRGPFELSFRIIHLGTGTPIWQSLRRAVTPSGPPASLHGITERVLDPLFPTAGQYELEVLADGNVIGTQILNLW